MTVRLKVRVRAARTGKTSADEGFRQSLRALARRLNPGPKPARKRLWRLHYPLRSAPPRIAAVGVPLAQRVGLRVFGHACDTRLGRYRPHALAGSPQTLHELARGLLEGRIWLPPLKAAVICLSRVGSPILSSIDRDQLWEAFQVPLFEQVRAPDGSLLAAECEAHDGLHVLGDEREFDPDTVSAEWDLSPCPCGLRRPRLRRREVRASMAAAAADVSAA